MILAVDHYQAKKMDLVNYRYDGITLEESYDPPDPYELNKNEEEKSELSSILTTYELSQTLLT